MRKPLWAGQGQDGLTYPPTPKKYTVSGLESLTALGIHRASLVAQMVKNPPAMWETWVRSLGGEDPLEVGHDNALQSSCLENPMDREPGGL